MERAVSFIRKCENYGSGKRKVSCITGGFFEKLEAAFDREREQSGKWPRESVQDKDHPMERKWCSNRRRNMRFLKKVAANWWTEAKQKRKYDRSQEREYRNWSGAPGKWAGAFWWKSWNDLIEREDRWGFEKKKRQRNGKADLKKEKRTSIARTKGAGLNKEKLIRGKMTVFYTDKCCELANGVCLNQKASG